MTSVYTFFCNKTKFHTYIQLCFILEHVIVSGCVKTKHSDMAAKRYKLNLNEKIKILDDLKAFERVAPFLNVIK